jgi:hypothetical protein
MGQQVLARLGEALEHRRRARDKGPLDRAEFHAVGRAIEQPQDVQQQRLFVASLPLRRRIA